ncbi:MAG: hypothetical protein ABF337_02395, partial [Akkermansiaceae bacterium]
TPPVSDPNMIRVAVIAANLRVAFMIFSYKILGRIILKDCQINICRPFQPHLMLYFSIQIVGPKKTAPMENPPRPFES